MIEERQSGRGDRPIGRYGARPTAAAGRLPAPVRPHHQGARYEQQCRMTGISAGKTTVARLLAQRGAILIDRTCCPGGRRTGHARSEAIVDAWPAVLAAMAA